MLTLGILTFFSFFAFFPFFPFPFSLDSSSSSAPAPASADIYPSTWHREASSDSRTANTPDQAPYRRLSNGTHNRD